MEAEKWGRRIRAYRKLKGFTQEGLSKKLCVSVSIVGEIERGNRLPSVELLNQIAKILNVSVHELTPPNEDRYN